MGREASGRAGDPGRAQAPCRGRRAARVRSPIPGRVDPGLARGGANTPNALGRFTQKRGVPGASRSPESVRRPRLILGPTPGMNRLLDASFAILRVRQVGAFALR